MKRFSTVGGWFPLLLIGCVKDYRVIGPEGFLDHFKEEARLIKDAKIWELFRQGTRWASDDVPRIDFEREVVVFVSAGERPMTGYRLKVLGIVRDGDTAFCTIREETSGFGGFMITYPSIVVAIRRETLSGAKHLSVIREKGKRELGRFDLP